MMDYSNTTMNESSGAVFELTTIEIVYIAIEATSELCLLIVLITYLLTKRRKTSAGCLMINLCLALLLLYIQSSCNKFISASGSVEGCIVIAVLGHWFILSMLISLAAYSLWIYLKIVRLFSEEPQYYKHKAFAATWLIPPIVTAISIAPDHHQFRKTKHLSLCKSNGYAFYFGTLLPSLFLLSFASVVMILSVIALHRHKTKNGPYIVTCHHLVSLERKMKLFLCVLIMAVIGWGSALIASDENVPTIVFIISAIPFLLCGFGQGVFIFIFACVLNPKVRQDWRAMITICHVTPQIDHIPSSETIINPMCRDEGGHDNTSRPSTV